MPDPQTIRAEQERRLRFLFALYDREQDGEEFSRADQVAKDIGMDPGTWYPIGRITQALAADYLITGSEAAAELNGLYFVRLAGDGRRLVESKQAGHEPPGGSPASIGGITISGSGNQTIFNIQQNSPEATQDATQYGEITAFDKRRILEWVAAVEQRAPSHGLSPDDLADVLQEVAELRAEVEKAEPDVSRLRRLGRSALRILGAGAGSLASNGLVVAGQEVFNQLGT
jgi:hypothetical protein